jgi:hypothetical protein
MAATTTEFDPMLLARDSCLPFSTAIVTSTGMNSTQGPPGCISLTTAGDVVRIPFNRPDGRMLIEASYWNTCTGSTAVYAAMALRNPPSTDKLAWRAPGTGIGTSTAESGWSMVRSTARILATSTGMQTFVFGPFETARYGHVMAASSNGIDAKQPFLEVMFGYSTAAAGTWAALATNAPAGGYYVKAMELPK